MLLLRLPVLSALLVLLLAAGRCTAATVLRGSGTRVEGRLDGRSVLELVGRYPKTRTEATRLTGHGMRTPERESRSHQGLGQYYDYYYCYHTTSTTVYTTTTDTDTTTMTTTLTTTTTILLVLLLMLLLVLLILVQLLCRTLK